MPKLLKKQGLRVDDIDVWELNEAFASPVVYCAIAQPSGQAESGGGSVAISTVRRGQLRLVGTIMNEMKRRNARYGVVLMWVGGGREARRRSWRRANELTHKVRGRRCLGA